jgi:N-acetylmuramoyl-L-alanine amidase
MALLTLLLASCASTSPGSRGRSSSGLDEWGNRPGPHGFGTVVIDAGHGGKDSGAVSRRTGLVEKTLTLDLARRLRSELRGSFRVVMVRDSDVFVDLDDRVRIANRKRDSVLVSLHFNAGPQRFAGPETYWWRVDSYTLAKRVQSRLSGVSAQDNSRGLVRRRLRLTRNPNIPCILVEGGYITNSREARSLADPKYRAQLARAIAAALREQAAEGDGDLGPLPAFISAPPSRHGDARSR